MSHTCDGSQPDCLTCAATAKRATLVRSALTAGDRLDDLTRARMWSRIDARIAEPGRGALAARRTRTWIALGGVAAAAAAVAIVAWRGGGAPGGHDATANAFVAPAETTLSAPLGPHTRAALVGPAQLELVGAPGDATTVKLDTGTLLAEFTGGTGRSLRVEAPGMVVDIVGTLFAVEVRGDGACVAVSHGRVRATVRDRVREVGGGEQLCTTDDAVHAIEAPLAHALTEHAAVIATREAAQTPPAQIIAPVAVAVVAPPTPAPVPIEHSSTSREPTHVEPIAAPHPHPRPIPATATATATATVTATVPVTATATATATATVPVTATVPATAPVTAPAPVPVPATAPVPAPAPSPPAAPPAPPLDPAESRYHDADRALAANDPAAADRALADLVTNYPSSSLVDQALYERARLAYARRAWFDARHHLELLASRPANPLSEPGAYLSCRILIETSDDGATRCITDFRASHPQSPHDLDLLGTLAQLAFTSGGCTAADSRVRELRTHYPTSSLAAAWTKRCPEAP